MRPKINCFIKENLRRKKCKLYRYKYHTPSRVRYARGYTLEGNDTSAPWGKPPDLFALGGLQAVGGW